MDGAGGFAGTAKGCDHAANIASVVEEAFGDEIFYGFVEEFCTIFEILVFVVVAGFADFAKHNGAEMAAAGGEALKVVEAGIAQIAGGDFAGCFALLFSLLGLVIWCIRFRLRAHKNIERCG